VNDWSDEETADPLYADDRNFYKVEKWTKDGTKVDSLPASTGLQPARIVFPQSPTHNFLVGKEAAWIIDAKRVRVACKQGQAG
jgi:hypothetical protein